MGEKVTAAVLEETGEGCSAGPEPMALVPWLVQEVCEFDEDDFDKTKTNYAFQNIFKPITESCGEFIPELCSTTFFQKPSHQGWLIVVCDNKDYTPSNQNYGDCFLWNPITKETIQLPTLQKFYEGEYGFTDCVLSSPPNHDNNSMVLFFGSNWDEDDNPYDIFLFCRPGETQWRIHKLSQDILDLLSPRWSKCLLCFKGKLYLMCAEYDYVGEHPDYHLEIDFTKDIDFTLSVKSFQVKNEVLFPLVGRKVAYSESQFAESHDELFRVDIIHSKSSGSVISVEVVRLNFSLMEWEKVNSVGDQVLFFGRHTIAYSSASDLGLTSGCLYYLLWFERSLQKLEIESTCYTVITWPEKQFHCSDWVLMPANLHGKVENILDNKDEENGFLMAPLETSSTIVNDENQGGQCSANEVQVASYWNNLNEDILVMVSNYLHGFDYKHFRSVCKENREIMPKVQPTSYLSPWLVFSRDHDDTIYSFVNPMYNNENYVMNLSELEGSTIRFQKGGWLLLSRDEKIFFYNPFTRETVKLPDMDRGYCYSVVSCSSIPTSSDCIVFAMDDRTDGFHIDIIRRGEAHWSSYIFGTANNIGKFERFLDTAFFHNEGFFCVNYHGTVGVFSAKDNSWRVIEGPDEGFIRNGNPAFLVKCGGDHLLVKLECNLKPIEIFRLEISERKLVKVESLEEHVLFISHTSCVSTVAPVSNMKNRIYFPRLYAKDEGIVFYSLETRSYHCFGRQHSAEDLPDIKGWFKNCTWIEPNRSISTIEELDWLKTPYESK